MKKCSCPNFTSQRGKICMGKEHKRPPCIQTLCEGLIQPAAWERTCPSSSTPWVGVESSLATVRPRRRPLTDPADPPTPRSISPPMAPADPFQHCWLGLRAVQKPCSHGRSPERVVQGFVTGHELGDGPFLGCFYSMSGFWVEVGREGTRPFRQDHSQGLFGCFALCPVANGSHPGRPGSWP